MNRCVHCEREKMTVDLVGDRNCVPCPSPFPTPSLSRLIVLCHNPFPTPSLSRLFAPHCPVLASTIHPFLCSEFCN
jgi:hypothetical protein